MQYFIPCDLDLNIELPPSENVAISPIDRAVKDYCLNNVKNFLKDNGGEIQFGWKLLLYGNIIIKLVGHAVAKLEDGSFLCVSPPSFDDVTEIIFIPDNGVNEQIINNCLPTKYLPIIDNVFINQFIALEEQLEFLRKNGGAVVNPTEIYQIQYDKTLLYVPLLGLAQAQTKSSDNCYCGSRKVRAECCV
ncbi:hypothetical protein [Thalassomonas haliotis]|uniref:Uncharacterized protein n=1 Tax=Thalassomonas haliotis TaxID=485448 RepID=A0ABY7V9Q9_9GAMM|nr:hypothetical protein [Thalassomonas haliotis]WDE10399.1 hypothetical protein H3N35_19280 [Thalassomonas haliotis]